MASVSPSTHFYSTSRAKRTLAGTPKLPVTAPRLKLNYTRPNARGVVDEAMEDDGLPDTKDLISTPSNAKVQRKNPPVKEASAAAEVIRTYELDINQDFRLDHITFSTQLLTHDLHDPNRLSYAEIVKAQNEIMQSRERGNSKVIKGPYWKVSWGHGVKTKKQSNVPLRSESAWQAVEKSIIRTPGKHFAEIKIIVQYRTEGNLESSPPSKSKREKAPPTIVNMAPIIEPAIAKRRDPRAPIFREAVAVEPPAKKQRVTATSTQLQLREEEDQKKDEMTLKRDELQKHWTCRGKCENNGRWCWIDRGSDRHHKMSFKDLDT
jgi:hypothetical protein